VRADNVVLATGVPILDRGLYFAKVEPDRSYALAFRYPSPPELMLLSAGSPRRSVRDAPTADGARLLTGGQGHVVGRAPSTVAHLDVLREWTSEWFPGVEETHAWSAQDYSSHDAVPIIGGRCREAAETYTSPLATGVGSDQRPGRRAGADQGDPRPPCHLAGADVLSGDPSERRDRDRQTQRGGASGRRPGPSRASNDSAPSRGTRCRRTSGALPVGASSIEGRHCSVALSAPTWAERSPGTTPRGHGTARSTARGSPPTVACSRDQPFRALRWVAGGRHAPLWGFRKRSVPEPPVPSHVCWSI
jgi:hypothetical protein